MAARTITDNTYRLVIEDGRRAPRVLEFQGAGAHSAFVAAERHCTGCASEVFENGRSLGSLRHMNQGGFWVITPARAALPAGGGIA